MLIYHRVGRRTAVDVDLPLELFADQIAELRATRSVVSLTDGLARLADPSTAREPTVAITFDDGTADFADLALGVLVEHRVPATLYVATEFVERGTSFPERRRAAHLDRAARRDRDRARRRGFAHPHPCAARPACHQI